MRSKLTKFKSLDTVFAIYVAAAVAVGCVAILGFVVDAKSNVERAWQDTKSSVLATSQMLTLEIQALKHEASLFVREKNDFLGTILVAPEPDAYIFDLADTMSAWFPKALAFTIGNSNGEPIISDFKGNLGPACREDLRRSANDKLELVPLHGLTTIPHFDIVVPIESKDENTGVLLITFPTKNMLSLLERHRDSRFELNYKKAAYQSKTNHPDKNEIDVFVKSVGESDIEVYGHLKPAFLEAARNGVTSRLLRYGGGFLLFATFGGWLLWRARLHILEEATTIQNLNRELQYTSTHDPLTGLANRRLLDEHLPMALGQAHREGKPVSLAMLDLDHFKRINDQLGHDQGDTCLRMVAAILRKMAKRPLDLAMRYGGEEFLMCWYDTKGDQAVQLAQDLQQQVRNMDFRHANGDAITISVGITVSSPDTGVEWPDLLKQTDDALYRAKSGGRDRIEFA